MSTDYSRSTNPRGRETPLQVLCRVVHAVRVDPVWTGAAGDISLRQPFYELGFLNLTRLVHDSPVISTICLSRCIFHPMASDCPSAPCTSHYANDTPSLESIHVPESPDRGYASGELCSLKLSAVYNTYAARRVFVALSLVNLAKGYLEKRAFPADFDFSTIRIISDNFDNPIQYPLKLVHESQTPTNPSIANAELVVRSVATIVSQIINRSERANPSGFLSYEIGCCQTIDGGDPITKFATLETALISMSKFVTLWSNTFGEANSIHFEQFVRQFGAPTSEKLQKELRKYVCEYEAVTVNSFVHFASKYSHTNAKSIHEVWNDAIELVSMNNYVGNISENYAWILNQAYTSRNLQECDIGAVVRISESRTRVVLSLFYRRWGDDTIHVSTYVPLMHQQPARYIRETLERRNHKIAISDTARSVLLKLQIEFSNADAIPFDLACDLENLAELPSDEFDSLKNKIRPRIVNLLSSTTVVHHMSDSDLDNPKKLARIWVDNFGFGAAAPALASVVASMGTPRSDFERVASFMKSYCPQMCFTLHKFMHFCAVHRCEDINSFSDLYARLFRN